MNVILDRISQTMHQLHTYQKAELIERDHNQKPFENSTILFQLGKCVHYTDFPELKLEINTNQN